MRVLEVGAAKGWAAQHLVPLGVEYVATDILADPNIGLGRGAFFERGSGRSPACRPTASTCRSRRGVRPRLLRGGAPPRARPLADGRRDGAGHPARRHRRGAERGHAGGRREREDDDQEHEKSFGINEHVHSLYAYLWAFWRAGLPVRRVEHAKGDDDLRDRRIGGRLRRLPVVGRSAADLVRPDLLRLLGRLALCP